MALVQLQINSGAWLRDEAIANLRSKYQVWIDRVGAPVLERVCREQELFTTDDVWAAFGSYPSPCERRVMGALMRGAALKGLILKTGVFEKSEQPQCHRREKALWKSLLYAPVKGLPVRSGASSASVWVGEV